jgi:hypothetical protein
MAIHLKPEVAAVLLAAGCPSSVLRRLESYTKMATILNGDAPGGCSNPVSAYATFAKRNPEFAKLWLPAERKPETVAPDAVSSAGSERCRCGGPMPDLDKECPHCGFMDL